MAEMTSSLTLQRTPIPASALRGAAELLRSTLARGDGLQLQVALGPSRAWSFDVRHDPIEIQLLEGEVLVTFEGDPNDHVLTAQGDAFKTSRRGKVAVAAFRPSRFSVLSL
jgi:hypothetical protein